MTLTHLSVTGFVVVALAIFFASAMQASIGFGMGMLAARAQLGGA